MLDLTVSVTLITEYLLSYLSIKTSEYQKQITRPFKV